MLDMVLALLFNGQIIPTDVFLFTAAYGAVRCGAMLTSRVSDEEWQQPAGGRGRAGKHAANPPLL